MQALPPANGVTHDHRSLCLAQEHTHYAATAARSESIILHIKLTTSCTQWRNRCTAHQWKPSLSSAHGEDGRGIWPHAKADQVQKTQCKDTTSHCFMRILIENNTNGSVFRPLYTRCSGCTLTHVFGMLLKYQSHVFWDTGRLMGPWQSHTGRMGLDRCEGKLFGQSETTSSLALTYTICTGLFWQCQRHLRHARFLPTGQYRDLPIQLVGWSVPASLPRKVPRRHGRLTVTTRATRPNPVPQVPRLPGENEGGCRQVPRLPRETKVDVAKCHACHAKCCGVTGD